MLQRALHAAVGFLFALFSLTTLASSEADLLPPERAFPLEASLSGVTGTCDYP